MRTIEFICTNNGIVHALFKKNGNIISIHFVGFGSDHRIEQAIRDWTMDGQIPTSMD